MKGTIIDAAKCEHLAVESRVINHNIEIISTMYVFIQTVCLTKGVSYHS